MRQNLWIRGKYGDLGNGYIESYLGLYNTVCRHRLALKDVEEFWRAEEISFDVNKLLTPELHPFNRKDIEKRMDISGRCGLYYCQLYNGLLTKHQWSEDPIIQG
jgi:hypothetical protein